VRRGQRREEPPGRGEAIPGYNRLFGPGPRHRFLPPELL
jgi:hypothetical protein